MKNSSPCDNSSPSNNSSSRNISIPPGKNATPGIYDDLSVPFREILLSKPHFLVSRSVYLCMAFLVLIIALTCLIRYPRILVTRGKIYSIHTAGPIAGSPDIYIRGYIPESYFQQLKPGLDVLIKLDAYPFQEYGLLRGKLLSVSAKLSDSGYMTISVVSNTVVSNGLAPNTAVPNGPSSQERRKIQYQEGMGTQMEIVLENERLLQKMFEHK
jgi:hypothetical protein